MKSISQNKLGVVRGWRESKQKSPRDIIVKFRYPEKSNLGSFQKEKYRLLPETSFTGTVDAGGQRPQQENWEKQFGFKSFFPSKLPIRFVKKIITNVRRDVPPVLSGEIA